MKKALTLLPLLGVVLVTFALFTPLCGTLYRCGCAMTDSQCNIHNETGPHCPWCQHPGLALSVLVLVLASEAGTFFALRRRGLAARSLAALAAFPIAGVVAGGLAWLPTDYPHFLALDARAKLHLPAGPIGCHGKTESCCGVGGN